MADYEGGHEEFVVQPSPCPESSPQNCHCFHFLTKEQIDDILFLQINRRCCYLSSLSPSLFGLFPYNFQFILSQSHKVFKKLSLYKLNSRSSSYCHNPSKKFLTGCCLASLPVRVVPLDVAVQVDLSLPLPPPLLLVPPSLLLSPVPPQM